MAGMERRKSSTCLWADIVDRQNVTHENPYDIFNIKSQTNSREMNARNQFEASNSVADDVPQLSYFRSACSSWLEAGGWKRDDQINTFLDPTHNNLVSITEYVY